MRSMIVLAGTIVAWLGSATHAWACTPVFRSEDQTIVITVGSIAPGALSSENFQVRAGDSDEASAQSGNCPVMIRISQLDGAPDPAFPDYTLRAPGNSRIEVLPNSAAGGTSRSDVDIANAPSGAQGRVIPFQVEFPTQWGLSAGTYSERLLFSLYDEGGQLRDTVVITLQITIPATLSLRLIGAVTGGPGAAQLDLGDLSSTMETHSPPFAALIVSTTPYSITITSEDHGQLVHDNGQGSIPYRLLFDGHVVDLTGANLMTYPEASPPSGDTRPMEIIVGPVDALAGHYSDRLTVTASAI